DGGDLVFRQQGGAMSIEIEGLRQRTRGGLLIARQQNHLLNALLAQQLNRVARRFARLIGNADHADGGSSRGHPHRGTSSGGERVQRCLHLRRRESSLLEQPVTTDDETMSAELSFGAATGECLERIDRDWSNPLAGCVRDDCPADWMLRSQFQ